MGNPLQLQAANEARAGPCIDDCKCSRHRSPECVEAICKHAPHVLRKTARLSHSQQLSMQHGGRTD
eukprot:4075472-Pleurochrysis_carterae.AAC.2